MTESVSQESEEYSEYASGAKPKIVTVGCGGAGCNTLSRMEKSGISGSDTIAINTDAQDLLNTEADKKVLIGKKLTKGLGTGANPDVGRKAAMENEGDLREILSGYDLVFLTYGLGGGTGTGAGPVVASVASRVGTLAVSIVTLPFEAEGKKKSQNASEGLSRLRENSDTTILVPDDKLLEIAPDLSLAEAFELADSVLMDTIAGITEMMSKPGLINLDFEDIRTTFEDGDMGVLGFGEYGGQNRAKMAVKEALNNPLLDMDIKNAKKALISVVGEPGMSLE
ncbi:MAG: cell division protein FtsZ, partial [Candidatus Hadarchaeia archaeon]